MKDTQDVQIQGVHSAQVELHQITERPEDFQLREGLQEHHVMELVDVLKQGRELDPVTLWEEPETGTIVLVDGHHRLAAYRQAEWSKPIPSQLHQCDRKAARLLAMGENGKARLQFTKTERLNAAWTLVCDGPVDAWTFSRVEIANATNVADGTVAKMRRTRKAIEEQGGDLDTSWDMVLRSQRFQGSQDFSEEDRAAWIEKQAAAIEDKVGKVIGFHAKRDPEALISVIMKRCHHECRQQLYEELMWEFDRDRVAGADDY